jgi:beta-glucosidase
MRVDPRKLRTGDREIRTASGSLQNVNREPSTVAQWQTKSIGKKSKGSPAQRDSRSRFSTASTRFTAQLRHEGTLFPQGTGMAATWNPELALRTAEITAPRPARPAIPWNFSPLLDVGRQPLWPRLYETYGEDSYVTTVMGLAMVRGYEGTNVALKTASRRV